MADLNPLFDLLRNLMLIGWLVMLSVKVKALEERRNG